MGKWFYELITELLKRGKAGLAFNLVFDWMALESAVKVVGMNIDVLLKIFSFTMFIILMMFCVAYGLKYYRI